MKRILLPTDFSENAWNAIQYAVSFFKNEECTFYILNAYQAGASSLVGRMNKERDTRLFRAIKDEALYEISGVLNKIKSKNNVERHQFKTLSIADSLLNAIGRTVIDANIDYIFMGTKGATGLKEVFLGSNTMKVIKEIDFCPLIAVPEGYTFNKFDKIIFTTGYEHLYEEYELLPMINIAKIWDSKIMVTHIKINEELTAQQKKSKEVLEKRLKGTAHEMVEVTDTTEIIGAINKMVAKNEDIGMVAILEYWHGFMEKITHENIVKKMAFHTKVPLLVAHLVD